MYKLTDYQQKVLTDLLKNKFATVQINSNKTQTFPIHVSVKKGLIVAPKQSVVEE